MDAMVRRDDLRRLRVVSVSDADSHGAPFTRSRRGVEPRGHNLAAASGIATGARGRREPRFPAGYRLPMTAPLCPSCGQPASQALAGPEHGYECRNEACPEYGQPLRVEEPLSVEPNPGRDAGLTP